MRIGEIISDAEKGNFEEFGKKVKQSMDDKLRNHPKFKQKQDDFLKAQELKQKLSSINKELTKHTDNENKPTKTGDQQYTPKNDNEENTPTE